MHFLLRLFLKAQKALLLSPVIHSSLVLTQIFRSLGNNKLHSILSSGQKGFWAWQRARAINTEPESCDLGEFLWSCSSRDSTSVLETKPSSAPWNNLCQMNWIPAVNLLPQTHTHTHTRKLGFWEIDRPFRWESYSADWKEFLYFIFLFWIGSFLPMAQPPSLSLLRV